MFDACETITSASETDAIHTYKRVSGRRGDGGGGGDRGGTAVGLTYLRNQVYVGRTSIVRRRLHAYIYTLPLFYLFFLLFFFCMCIGANMFTEDLCKQLCYCQLWEGKGYFKNLVPKNSYFSNSFCCL